LKKPRAGRRSGRRAVLFGLATLSLAGCRLPEGNSDGTAIAGFRPTGGEVTITAPVAWVNGNGEIILAVEGRPTPVYTGYLRQPASAGEILTVEGWQESGGRKRILARRITTDDGRQVFPPA
jgi:hypothetical protein